MHGRTRQLRDAHCGFAMCRREGKGKGAAAYCGQSGVQILSAKTWHANAVCLERLWRLAVFLVLLDEFQQGLHQVRGSLLSVS